MRPFKVRQFSKVAAVAMLVLIAGCNDSEASGGISTDANSTEDAALDDVLGANDAGENQVAAAPDPQAPKT